MPSFDTEIGDIVEIEGPDGWYDRNLYVEYTKGDSTQGVIRPKEGCQLDLSGYISDRPIFEMKLSKSNEPVTHHLRGCRFSTVGFPNSSGRFEADHINLE